MDKIFKALESLIPVIGNHPLASVLLGAFVMAVLFILTVKAKPEILDTLFKPRKGQRHFMDSIQCGIKIQAEMDKLLGATKADKTSAWLYSNGASSLSGVPYLNTKISYISRRNGVDFNEMLMSHYTPLTAFSDYMPEMWQDPKKPKFVKRDKNDIEHPLMQSQFALGGTELSYGMPITDVYGNAAGMLFLSYQDRTHARPTDTELEHACRNTSMIVSGLLNNMTDHKPFWKIWLK